MAEEISLLPQIDVSNVSFDSAKGTSHQEKPDHLLKLQCLIKSKRISNQSKIYIILPPVVPERVYNHTVAKGKGYLNYTPAGIMYIAATIRDSKIDQFSENIHLIDLNNKILQNSVCSEEPDYKVWKSELSKELSGQDMPIFIISYMFATSKENFIEVSEFIRKEKMGSLIIAGGVQATFDPECILNEGHADIISMYEGESSLPDLFLLIRDLLDNVDSGLLPGSLKFKYDSTIYTTHVADRIDTLELDINEYYDQLEIGSYYKAGTIGGGYSNFLSEKTGIVHPWVNILTKRGCRAACVFCTVRNFNGKGIRLRSIDTLREELDHLYFNHNIRHVDWLDDDFLFDKNHTRALLTLLATRYPELRWTASNGLIGTAIEEETMDLMAKSGLSGFSIGVESGNSEVIKNIRKPTTLQGLIRRKPILQKYPKILFMANFIIGFPSETFSQMLDTYFFTRKLECDWSKYFVCQPLKGTDIYQNFQSMGDSRTKKEDWEQSGPNPGRMVAESGGLQSASDAFKASWGLFSLDPERTFTKKEHDEIWFTFNLVTNFICNPCYKDKLKVEKLHFFLKALRRSYPTDASMSAALANCYRLLGNNSDFVKMRDKTVALIADSDYWKSRVCAFPEILTLAGATDEMVEPLLHELSINTVPKHLVPTAHKDFVEKSLDYYDSLNWQHKNTDADVLSDIKIGLGPATWGH